MEQLPFLSLEEFNGACGELLTRVQRIEKTCLDVKIRDEVRMATGNESGILHEALLTWGLE